jgi:hypothetical protein
MLSLPATECMPFGRSTDATFSYATPTSFAPVRKWPRANEMPAGPCAPVAPFGPAGPCGPAGPGDPVAFQPRSFSLAVQMLPLASMSITRIAPLVAP